METGSRAAGAAAGSKPPADGAAGERLDARLLRLAAVLLCGGVPALLDTTVVAVALEPLIAEFGGTVATAQWVVSAYLLAITVVIPLAGWGLERWGAKAMWSFALTVYAAGLEGLAVLRVVQGIGGGLILPLLQAVLAEAAGPARVGRAMLLVMVPGQLVPVLGPVLGGLVVDALGWRWIFLGPVPVSLAALVLGRRLVPAPRRRGVAMPDVVGLALLLPGQALLLYGLRGMGGGIALERQAVTGCVVGAALLAGFVMRALPRGPASLLDLRLFGRASFSLGAGLLFVAGLATWAPTFLFPLFYQRARGAAALEAGVLLAPQGIGMALAMVGAGRLADRARAAVPLVAVGTALAVAATLPFAVAGGRATDGLYAVAILARGVGLGLAGIPTMALLYRDVAPEGIGRATSLASVVQRCGAAFGTAALAVALQARLGDAAGAGGDPAAVNAAFAHAFRWVIGFTALAWVPAALAAARRRVPRRGWG